MFTSFRYQVAVMQKELQDLAPKLAQANVETAALIERIERDTVDVEKVKAVVSAEEAIANEAAMAAKAIKVCVHCVMYLYHHEETVEYVFVLPIVTLC